MALLEKLKKLLRRDGGDEGHQQDGEQLADRRIDAVGDLPTTYLPKGGYDEGRAPR